MYRKTKEEKENPFERIKRNVILPESANDFRILENLLVLLDNTTHQGVLEIFMEDLVITE